MPFLKSTHFLFITATALGTTLAVSGTSWPVMFAGMELNMLAFIPLMIQNNSAQEHESATKYLLAQTLGAFTLLLGGLWSESNDSLGPKWLLFIGLMTKLGAAPTHLWFPGVMSGLSWPMCALLSTWQKVFPLLGLSFLLNTSHTSAHLFLLASGAIKSAHSGLNQATLRGLIAYSSITHINWILIISVFNPLAATLYFMIYTLSTLTIMALLYPLNLSSPNISSLTSLSNHRKQALTLMFFSLAGLPPFLGFLPKWQGLQILTTPIPLIPLLFAMASLTSLLFYLKLTFFILLTPPSKQLTPDLPITYIILPLLIFSINLTALFPLFRYALIMFNQPQ